MSLPRVAPGEAPAVSFPVSPYQAESVRQAHAARLADRHRADNLLAAYLLRGPLDADALERALRLLVRRHEPLRTVYSAAVDPPVGVVLPGDGGFSLRRTSAPEAAETADAVAERVRPFDIGRGPVFRATLARVHADRHVLALALDHIVCDGQASLGLLTRELAAVYGALASGGDPALPELPYRYADFAVAHRRYLSPATAGRIAAYWRDQLPPEGPLPGLDLPRLVPATASEVGLADAFSLPIPETTRACIATVGREERASQFMVVLAGLLLAMWSFGDGGRRRVGVMAPALNAWPGMERLVGHFGNQVVVGLPLHGTMGFRDVLAEVRRRTLGAVAHSDLPFEDVLRAVYPPRVSEQPWPPYVFYSTRPRVPHGPWEAAGVSATPLPLPAAGKPKLHPGLKVQAIADGDDLCIAIEYAGRAYAREVVASLASRTLAAVERAAGDRSITAAELSRNPPRTLGRAGRESCAGGFRLSG